VAFTAARVAPAELVVSTDRPPPDGERARVTFRLPAAGILEERDATIEAEALVTAGPPSRAAPTWRLRLEGLQDRDRDRVAMMAASYRYVPFGPFLALGGAATLLYGSAVHWLITEGYPAWVRGVLG
jgi:hypothetical protein